MCLSLDSICRYVLATSYDLKETWLKYQFQQVKYLNEASLSIYNVETSYIVSLIYLKALLA